MEYSTETYKRIYDDAYTAIDNYNYHNVVKDIYVDVYAAYVNGKILDAGCGEGIHLKRMISSGHDAFGIELSTVCCDKYLQDIPHKNIDILSYAREGHSFDGLICMDVLEHIPPENINETLMALSKLSNSAFLGIANHSDIINGVELHLIREDKNWWNKILHKYYKNVHFLTEQFDGKFYYFYCSVHEQEDSFYFKINDIIRQAIKIDEERIEAIEAAQKNKKENSVLTNEHVSLQKKLSELENAIRELNEKIAHDSIVIAKKENEIKDIYDSRGWLWLQRFRKFIRIFR